MAATLPARAARGDILIDQLLASPGNRVRFQSQKVSQDFLIYTPQGLNEAAKVNPFVRDEILSKGKVVYRAAA